VALYHNDIFHYFGSPWYGDDLIAKLIISYY